MRGETVTCTLGSIAKRWRQRARRLSSELGTNLSGNRYIFTSGEKTLSAPSTSWLFHALSPRWTTRSDSLGADVEDGDDCSLFPDRQPTATRQQSSATARIGPRLSARRLGEILRFA